jgi:hypothetical protein
MPYSLKINKEMQQIEVYFDGALSGKDLGVCTAAAAELQFKHSIYSVFINAGDLEFIESVTDIYDLPKQYVELGVSRSTRIAITMPKLESARSFIRFYENVCINRGWIVRTFETQGEAEKWLSLSRQQ